MKIQLSDPSEPFKPFIRYYKYIESEVTGIYKVVPNTFVELYFNFTNFNIFSPGIYDLDNPRIHVSGLHQYDQNCFSHMLGTDRRAVFAIVFEPQGFFNLFKIKSSDFCNNVINGDSILKNDFYKLWEKLQAFSDVEEMKRLAEKFLLDYAKKASGRLNIINNIINYMDNSNGMIRVSQICNLFNVTPRSLNRYFKDEIGISPKELLNIFRITKAIKLIIHNPECDMTGISYLNGYYDQSHFIKEIIRIAGRSPGHIRGSELKNIVTFHNLVFIKKD